jgi:altered-inheritance-of-mitochondria protein 5
MVETPNLVQAPPSAATRLKPHPISAEVKAHWNREVEALYRGFQNLDERLVGWGRSVKLYGPSEGSKRTDPSPSIS